TSIRSACSEGPSRNNCTILAADASRLAALLVAYILPVCALLTPCQTGASTPRTAHLFRNGPLLLQHVFASLDRPARRGPAPPGTAHLLGSGPLRPQQFCPSLDRPARQPERRQGDDHEAQEA